MSGRNIVRRHGGWYRSSGRDRRMICIIHCLHISYVSFNLTTIPRILDNIYYLVRSEAAIYGNPMVKIVVETIK
jgi:hypothetical protein